MSVTFSFLWFDLSVALICVYIFRVADMSRLKSSLIDEHVSRIVMEVMYLYMFLGVNIMYQ